VGRDQGRDHGRRQRLAAAPQQRRTHSRLSLLLSSETDTPGGLDDGPPGVRFD
jgi:hypothetical protein